MTGAVKTETSTAIAATFIARRESKPRPDWQARRAESRWRRLQSRWRRFQAISLALDGMSSPEISAITGLTRDNVLQTCSRAGVKIACQGPKAERITRAAMAVADGYSVVDAAAKEGLSAPALRVVLGARNVAPPGNPGPGDGRARRAARGVLFDGLTVREAAARERCEPSGVYAIMSKIRRDLGR